MCGHDLNHRNSFAKGCACVVSTPDPLKGCSETRGYAMCKASDDAPDNIMGREMIGTRLRPGGVVHCAAVE